MKGALPLTVTWRGRAYARIHLPALSGPPPWPLSAAVSRRLLQRAMPAVSPRSEWRIQGLEHLRFAATFPTGPLGAPRLVIQPAEKDAS